MTIYQKRNAKKCAWMFIILFFREDVAWWQVGWNVRNVKELFVCCWGGIEILDDGQDC